MNFVIKITSGDTVKEYTIPDNVDVQCGDGDEMSEGSVSASVRCSVDIGTGSEFPTILRQIENECGEFDNYSVQCLFDSVAIYEQDDMTTIKYRLAKMKGATTIREEVTFYA